MRHKYIKFIILSLTIHCSLSAQKFTVVSPQIQAQIYVGKYEADYIHLAVKDFVSDIKKITGREIQVVHTFPEKSENIIVVATSGNPKNRNLFKKLAFDTVSLSDKWESYCVQSFRHQENNILMIAGSDERGTMFGLYHFIELYLGVDPFYFWSGNEPKPRETLHWEHVNLSAGEPSFKLRGWFINDEDLLTEWENGGGKRNIDYPFYGQVVTAGVMQHIVEALVRSRYNLIIPASFIDILNPAEAHLVDEAVKRGVFVSQHHIEPLGVSGHSFFNYWKPQGKDYKFSYYSNKEQLMEVWETYVRKWSQYPNVVWQIGLRGIGDNPMWYADKNVPQSNAERGKIISDAMQAQINLIEKYNKGEKPFITTTLWGEGSFLNNEGFLKIPEDVTIVFADNNPGWRWQTDFYSTQRNPKNTYGIYYHIALWESGPHLAQVIPPHKTFDLLREAQQNQACQYAIFNVSNVREFVLPIHAASQMLWNINEFNPDTFLQKWIQDRFPIHQETIFKAYKSYFSSYATHPKQEVPIFMDGQIFYIGIRQLRLIEDKINNPHKNEKESITSSDIKDVFALSLSDMHLQDLHIENMLQLLYAQKTSFYMVDLTLKPLLKQLPSPSSQLLYDNLIFQNSLMIQLCIWLENIYLAHIAVNKGNIDACAELLSKSVKVFPVIEDLVDKYCYGKWKEWYRGDKKMNILAKADLTRKALELSKSKIE